MKITDKDIFPELVNCAGYRNETVAGIIDGWITFIKKSDDKTKLPMMLRLFYLASGASFPAIMIERIKAFVETLDKEKKEVRVIREWMEKNGKER